MPDGSVSVCLATFNGSNHIRAQLDSILSELCTSDEVVIVDDCSVDATVEVIRGFQDARIRVFVNDVNRGHVASFERALGLASHPHILLADQDDIWTPGRRKIMLEGLARRAVVASNHRTFEGSVVADGYPRFRHTGPVTPPRVMFSLLFGHGPYFGCAMGLSDQARNLALPFPSFVEAHDHWIALVGARLGGVYSVESDTVMRRLHDSNLTPRRKRPFGKIVATRIRLLLSAAALLWRSRRRRPRR